jgi:hypothetical protein
MMCCMGLNVVSGGLRREEGEKMNHDFHRGSFSRRTGRASHFLGPPWCFSLPKSFVEQEQTTHIPLERGGADAFGLCACLLGVVSIELTSLKRGEKLLSTNGCASLGANRGGEGEGRWTNNNRDAVDVEFKLHSPSKIGCDIDVRSFDKELKICIIL